MFLRGQFLGLYFFHSIFRTCLNLQIILLCINFHRTCNLQVACLPDEIFRVTKLLNIDLDRISSGCTTNGPLLNSSKSIYTVISSSKKCAEFNPPWYEYENKSDKSRLLELGKRFRYDRRLLSVVVRAFLLNKAAKHMVWC